MCFQDPRGDHRRGLSCASYKHDPEERKRMAHLSSINLTLLPKYCLAKNNLNASAVYHAVLRLTALIIRLI